MAPVRRRWALIACVVAAGVVCSPALAADPPPSDPPPSDPTPTVPAPPPAIAPGPVATVPSPPSTPPLNLKPDLPPVQRKKAPASKPAPALKAAPARKPTPAPKPIVRATARPSTHAPVRVVTRPARPVRAHTFTYPRRSAKPPTRRRALVPAKKQQHMKKKPKPKPEPAPFLGSKLAPHLRTPTPVRQANPPEVPARKARANVLPLPTLAPSPTPSGLKQGLVNLRWLLFAIVGTCVVFLTAVGSRRLYERRPSAVSSGSLLPPTDLANPAPRLADLLRATQQAGQNGPSEGPAVNGTSHRSALNGTSEGTAARQAEPAHSRRRCLIPGCVCHQEDHHAAGHQSG
jgi:hypothetical protein